VGFFITTFVAE